MRDRKVFEEIADEIKEAGKSLMRYNGHADRKGSDYADGWTDAVDQFVLELLGRKEQDGSQLLIQAVNNLPSSSKEITCEFCSNKAFDMTPGGDLVCISCGDEIIENAKGERL
jgi:hypothetical protein